MQIEIQMFESHFWSELLSKKEKALKVQKMELLVSITPVPIRRNWQGQAI